MLGVVCRAAACVYGMPSSIIFLTGAPEARSLKWEEEYLLPADAFPLNPKRVDSHSSPAQPDVEGLECPQIQWRSLSYLREPLKTGMTQSFETPLRPGLYDYTNTEGKDASFFTTTSFTSRDTQEVGSGVTVGSEDQDSSSAESQEILSQFYDHSRAVHEDLSQPSIDGSTNGNSFADTTDSFYSAVEPGPRIKVPETQASESNRPDPFQSCQISDLNTIPSGTYLHTIAPQTVTVNLIAGVISIPPPRTVVTRRWGTEMSIIEMIVGDETKAGFGVTFWLPRAQDSGAHGHPQRIEADNGSMREVLESLRPSDIVLLKTVALSTFRGKVHGQSMRKNRTSVELLYRRRIDATDQGGLYGVRDLIAEKDDIYIAKTRRVKDWAMNFISGVSGQEHRLRDGPRARKRSLPPDTQ